MRPYPNITANHRPSTQISLRPPAAPRRHSSAPPAPVNNASCSALTNSSNGYSNQESIDEQEFTAKILMDKITGRQSSHLPPTLTLAAATISSIWRKKTWQERARLWRKMSEFARKHGTSHHPLGMQAVAFISSLAPTTALSTRITYASHLRSLLHRLSIKTPLLDLYASSLPLTGSTLPEQQAVPCPRELAYSLVDELLSTGHHDDLAALLYLCWKTASRWSDIMGLTGSSFVSSHLDDQQSPPFLVLFWGPTKTNPTQRFKAWMWTVVAERHRPDLLRRLDKLFRETPKHRPLTELTTEHLTRLLRLDPRAKRLGLSSYSIRRGATQVLVEGACNGLCNPRTVPLLLKHNDDLHQFPASTLRYAPDKTKLALMLGTQHATVLL